MPIYKYVESIGNAKYFKTFACRITIDAYQLCLTSFVKTLLQ